MLPRLLLRTSSAYWLGAGIVAVCVVLGGAVLTLVQLGEGARPSRNLVLSLALGLLLGIAYVALRLLLDHSRRTPDTVEQRFKVPVVTSVPLSDRLGRTTAYRTAPVEARGETTSQLFDELLTDVASRLTGDRPRVLVVTSPEPRDGRSTVAAHLALAAARSGERVVLLDTDLRHPTLATRFGLVEGIGLTDVLNRRVAVADVLQPTVHDGLEVLAGGTATPDPGTLLASEALRGLVAELAQRAVVVVDAPPVLPTTASGTSTGAAELSAAADGTLVVVSAHDTRDRALDDTLRRLRSAGGRSLFLVVNRVGRSSPAYRSADRLIDR